MANNISNSVQEWLKLSNQGLFVEAKSFYFNNLFDEIIERFVDRTAGTDNKCDVLFSILGFTPEPIILTQRALLPSVHVIFTTSKDYDSDSEIVAYLEKYLTSDYKIVNLGDDSFGTIYSNLRAQMNIYPSTKYVIDITGGKKSMVASAAIFAKDHNCDVVYVDYDEYIPTLRRPMPGTERLNVVYSAIDNLLDTIDFTSLGVVKQEDGEKLLSHSIVENVRRDFDKKQLVSKPTSVSKKDHDNAFKDSFNKTFLYLVDEKKGNRGLWLPKGMSLSLSSERTIVLKHDKSGETLSLQRAQLFGFYRRYKLGVEDAHQFFDASSRKSKIFNSAIYSLLNAINYELFKERI